MSINLSNVNISLNEFQRLSQGEYNAGEVKLAGETKLAKMNNHVGSFFVNKDIISHEEVIAIKQALVKALSQNGVDADELASIRKELGIASADASDRDLRHRSIMPLTRQQIREILDRNAAKINDFNAANHGSVYISKLSQLHQAGPAAKSAQVRNAVNAKLAEGNRQVNVNEDILHFQSILSNSIDFLGDAAERSRIVAMAKTQLAALMQSCGNNPSAEEPAVATFDLPHGRTASIAAGMSQKALVDRLEDVIVRFSSRSPSNAELDVVKRCQSLRDDQEKNAFLSDLSHDPDCGQKSRALAIRWLYSRGVTDHATLSIANRLDSHDAYAFAAALLALPKDATPEQIRENPAFAAMAAKAPVQVARGKMAYVPATSNAEYNAFVRASLMQPGYNYRFPQHNELAEFSLQYVRTHLGDAAMPGDTSFDEMVKSASAAGLEPTDPNVRLSAEGIRESVLGCALKNGAHNLVTRHAGQRIAAAGGDGLRARAVATGVATRHPELIQGLMAAQTPEAAQAAIAQYDDRIGEVVRLYCLAQPLANAAASLTRSVLAEKLGVAPALVENTPCGIVATTEDAARKLVEDILFGKRTFANDAEIETAFRRLSEDAVSMLQDLFRETDALELPQKAKDGIKTHILGIQKLDLVDPGLLFNAAGNINPALFDELETALAENASTARVMDAMKPIAMEFERISGEMLNAKGEVGPDDRDGLISIMLAIGTGLRPRLETALDAFFSRQDVKAAFAGVQPLPQDAMLAAGYFRQISSDDAVNPGGRLHAETAERLFRVPRERAAFKAAGGEQAALQAGYHTKEMPMLARAFTLFKAATGCTDDDAMRAALDPQSKARRVASYGGRFTKSAESFGKGLALIDRFDRWFQAFVSDVNAGNRDTLSKLNIYGGLASPKCARAMEKFILEEIACNAEADLDEENAGNLFDMEHNKAMRFVGRGYAEDSTIRTLAAIPPEKRGLVYDVFAILDGPLGSTRQEVDAKTPITSRSMTLSRVLRQYDELEEMRSEGQLSRERLVEMLFGDFGVAPDAGNRQINNACFEKFAAKPQNLWDPIQAQLDVTGASFDECAAAIDEGRRLDIQRHVGGIATYNGIESLGGGIENALKTFTKDLNRASGANSLPGGEPLLDAANVCFTFKFPGEQSVSIHTAAKDDPVVVEKTSDIVGRINSLCGTVHTEQLSSVYYALSQNGVCKNIKNGFSAQNIFTDEHTAMTFTLSKDNATGAVTIAYNEPAGFPFKFHWTTTVALDGTITSTPMVVEHPQQPQPANP